MRTNPAAATLCVHAPRTTRAQALRRTMAPKPACASNKLDAYVVTVLCFVNFNEALQGIVPPVRVCVTSWGVRWLRALLPRAPRSVVEARHAV
ncbi:hypothetical protein EON67_04090 [archaeon]|nr:MAG: hypothetical protein EON67_04090 [archaeon]